MREAVVVASSRTGLAKSFRGSFNMTRPEDLAAHCIKDVLRKTPQLDPKEIEDVILGCGQPHGVQGHNIARVAALRAGLPVSAAAITVNRFCSSGLQAVAMAAHQIVNEGADAAIGGGVESISLIVRDNDPSPCGQTEVPGHLHGDGRNRRSRRQALQDQPPGPGRIFPDQPAAHRARPAGRFLQRRNRAHESHQSSARQENRSRNRHAKKLL